MGYVTDDLTTTAEVQLYLGVSGDASLLAALIDAASQAIKNYLKDNITSVTYTEYYDGPRTNEFILNHRPIISITGIWDDTDFDWTTDDELIYADDDYRYYADEGRIVGYEHTFSEGVQNVKITYTAGYATIPADVNLACQMQVAYWYNKAKKNADGIESERLGEYSIAYAKAQAAGGQVCEDAKVLLSSYRNMQI